MAHYEINTNELPQLASTLRAGDTVSLSGDIYTARDAAHKKLVAALDEGMPLPFDLKGATIYYAGPTPAKPGAVIGSCGPTTSGRMDVFSPRLLAEGLCCMIGKGVRDQATAQAMQTHGAVYLAAIGGAGAVIADSVKALTVVAYEELGCESIKRLTVQDFPAIVAMDTVGGNLYIKQSF